MEFSYDFQKKKKKKKNKSKELEHQDNLEEPPEKNNDFLEVLLKKKKKKKSKESEQNDVEESPEKTNDFLKEPKKPLFDINKLKDLISNDSNKKKNSDNDTPKKTTDHVAKLKSAQFRHLNEQLYTQTGSQSLKMFKKDPKSFKVYHEGFRNQAEKWPVDPLNLIITAIMKM